MVKNSSFRRWFSSGRLAWRKFQKIRIIKTAKGIAVLILS